MKKNHTPKMLFIIFALVGILLLVFGAIFTVNSIRFRQTAVEVTATITDIDTYRDSDGDTHHNVYVSYYYDDSFYDFIPLNSYTSRMYEGKKITILCSPDNPAHIQSPADLYIVLSILGILGISFLAIGTIPLIAMNKRQKVRKELMSSGLLLHAVVNETRHNTTYRVNGKSPYVIYCSYYDEYKDVTYHFKSDNLWTNPQSVFPAGSTINVYVDRNDYSRYAVDAQSALENRIMDFT